MKSLILAAALAVTALVGIHQARAGYCQQDCWRDANGGMHCTTRCY